MNIPMMWMAAGTASGSLCWSFWGPLPITAMICPALLAVWLHFGRTQSGHIILAMIGFFVTGMAMPTNAPPVQTVTHIMGTIVHRVPFGAMVRTNKGDIWIKMESPPRVGDSITALLEPAHHKVPMPGAYDSIFLRAKQGLPTARSISWAKIGPQRTVSTALPEALHPGIIRALATGDRSAVNPTTLDTMKRTGTLHLLAISGLHVGMAASMGWVFGWLISRPLIKWPMIARVVPTISALLLSGHYGSLVDWPVSTQRAFGMIVAIALARLLDRKTNPWHVWSMALVWVLTLRPAHVASVGTWMSFGAVAALIGWTPRFASWLPIASPTLRWAWQSLVASTAATLGVLPASAWVFQEVSVGAPLSNMLAIPLMAMIGVPTAMLAIHGPACIREPMMLLCDFSIESCLMWLRFTDLGTWNPAVGPGGALLMGFAIFLHQRPKWAVVLIGIALIRPQAHNKTMNVSFPNVGQGGAALVEFPDGRNWLIDAGPPGKRVLHWLRRRGIRRLDAVFLTHPDTDHLGGLVAVLDNIPVKTLWSSRRPHRNETMFHNLWRDAAQRGTRLRVCGKALADNDNEDSLVIRLRHGHHSFLLTGDIGSVTERNMIPRLQPFTVVQVPHHGSKGSSSIDFVSITQPSFAVVQSGRNNRYGHPHPSVVERWNGRRVRRTDRLGNIDFYSDGSILNIRSQVGQDERVIISQAHWPTR